MAVLDPPDAVDSWDAWQRDMDTWRARMDEKLVHVATKRDLETLKVWMILTSLSVGGLVVALVKVLP